ncbi:MAG: DUF2304 domain-containing protein [Geodermatophilaceae bacterium]|nr:DUF2304 domain-containing protein [Geodermatophilaceae bacterium]
MSYVVAVVAAILVLGFMLELLRRRQLSEKYAALWLIVGVGVLVLLLAPGLLQGISEALGFEVPANFLFLLALTLLLLVSVHLSWELSRLEDETRVLAEELALLRSSLERLQACVQRSKNASEDNQAPRVVDSE